MILVDTSVWVDHLRSAEPHLQGLLKAGQVLMHAMVLGEICCGSLPNRRAVLQNLGDLPAIHESDHGEVMSMIEEKSLMSRGIGFIDVHLLCSVVDQGGTHLWTRDGRLQQIAVELGVAYSDNV